MINEKLRLEVERCAGRTVKAGTDFALLSDLILQRTREYISPTTIKRMWGYVEEQVQPRQSTLDVLARFVGYRSYTAFLCSEGSAQSRPVLSHRLTSEDLKVGQKIRLSWPPDHSCLIRYNGNGRFCILEVENTKLAVGDTFCCHLFLEYEPLYLDHLMHLGEGPMTYVVGEHDGIIFRMEE